MTGAAATVTDPTPPRRLPVLQGILPFDRGRVPADVLAGITLAALGIPEVMGYTKIAGMPVVTGLYTILIPIAIFALLGSSRHLVVGADSATAAIMFAGLASLAMPASAEWVAMAGVLALMTAGILILARIIRLGFLADFLSRSVLIGFLTGVGIQVAMGQVAGMLGVAKPSGGTIESFLGTLRAIPSTSTNTLLVSVGVLATILILRRVDERIPGALIAVIGAIVASWAIDLASRGVALLGTVPSGLPAFGFPTDGWDQWQVLLPTAGALFLVILAQSAATSRAYAARFGDAFSEDVDLVGLGASNIAAGLSGTFVVNGSPTKSKMVESAGGTSQVAMLVTAAIVLVVILFLTVPLSYMPDAVLSSIVFLIGLELIDYRGMLRVLRSRRDEFVIAAITALVVVVVGVMQGIVLAIVLSIIDHLRFSYRPHDSYVVSAPGGGLAYKAVTPTTKPVEAAPGLVIYRFGGNLYYANTERFVEEIRKIINIDQPPAWVGLHADAIGDIDFSGSETLRDLQRELNAKGVRLVFAEVNGPVHRELKRDGIVELYGADAFHDTVDQMLSSFKTTGTTPGSAPATAST